MSLCAKIAPHFNSTPLQFHTPLSSSGIHSHSFFSSSILTLFSHSITNLPRFPFFAIWVCLKFLLQRFNCFSQRKCGTFFIHNHVSELNNNTHLCLTFNTRLCSSTTNGNTYELSDSSSHEGSEESKESKKGKSLSINAIMKKLKRYGVSGILSYGLLNTAYYLTTFLFVWFYIAPAPGKMGYRPAVERFLKLLAMVWAGSQVTKLLRAAGALALAPFVDRGLTWFTNKFKFQSQGKAFAAIVGFCFGLALIVFLVITLLWA